MEKLKECIDMAQKLGSPLVRIMSFRKEMVLFGAQGAEKWNVSDGAWNKLVELLTPVVQLAKESDIMLVVETGNNAMITSCYLGRKLIDDLGTIHLKVLWDPANALYCGENPSEDALDSMKGGYLGHVHMKDVWWGHGDGTVGVFGGHTSFGEASRYWDFRSLGHGDIQFEDIIVALNDISASLATLETAVKKLNDKYVIN